MAKKKYRRNNRCDWKAAKLLYIAGEPDPRTGRSVNYSYGDIARIFGVGKTTVASHAKEEGWPELRKQYQDKRESDTLDILRRIGIEDVARVQATNIAAATGSVTRYMATLSSKSISTWEFVQVAKYLDTTIKEVQELAGKKAEEEEKPSADQILGISYGDIVKAMLEKVRKEGIF